MNKHSIAISLIGIGLLAAGGVGLYQLGKQTALSPAPVAAPASEQTTLTTTGADPSAWGIKEGEAATRRHIDSGLKAGDVDPVTALTILYYHDPMKPAQKFDEPGKSPFMDMMLIPVYAGTGDADPSSVTVSSRMQQNLGLRTTEVIRGSLALEVAAVGTIAWNERDQFTVQARAPGFVEKLHVRAALDRVVKGQALFDIYVPDWVAVQEDYLSLRRMQGPDLASLVDAARQRMRQAGMSEAQIALVERSDKLQTQLTVLSPANGVVTELLAREGSTVLPGAPLARINGLSSVWAQAEVPESQVSMVFEGSGVTASTPALTGQTFDGKVQALLPEVNPLTRTRIARVELANPEGLLVPGMFVHMLIAVPGSPPVALVPSEALIRSGRRTLVITVEEGAFRPVEVLVGAEQNGQSEILNGVTAGQTIVLSGQFLIDSEASLKGVEDRLRPDPVEPSPGTMDASSHGAMSGGAP